MYLSMYICVCMCVYVYVYERCSKGCVKEIYKKRPADEPFFLLHSNFPCETQANPSFHASVFKTVGFSSSPKLHPRCSLKRLHRWLYQHVFKTMETWLRDHTVNNRISAYTCSGEPTQASLLKLSPKRTCLPMAISLQLYFGDSVRSSY